MENPLSKQDVKVHSKKLMAGKAETHEVEVALMAFRAKNDFFTARYAQDAKAAKKRFFSFVYRESVLPDSL